MRDQDLSRRKSVGADSHEISIPLSKECLPTHELAHCFLRLANLPSYVLDRLSRYEATIWRQAAQVMFTLDALKRRKPWEGRRLVERRRYISRNNFGSHEI